MIDREGEKDQWAWAFEMEGVGGQCTWHDPKIKRPPMTTSSLLLDEALLI